MSTANDKERFSIPIAFFPPPTWKEYQAGMRIQDIAGRSDLAARAAVFQDLTAESRAFILNKERESVLDGFRTQTENMYALHKDDAEAFKRYSAIHAKTLELFDKWSDEKAEFYGRGELTQPNGHIRLARESPSEHNN